MTERSETTEERAKEVAATAPADARSFIGDISTYIRAGYPILNIVTAEEERALDLLVNLVKQNAGRQASHPLRIWSISRGFVDDKGQRVGKADTRAPDAALAHIAVEKQAALFVLKDFHPYLKEGAAGSSLLVRTLRDLARELRTTGKTIVWLTPVQYIPPELEKDVTLVDLPLPSEVEYRKILDDLIEGVREKPRVLIELDEEGRDEIVKACQGLTWVEAENALAKAIASRQGLSRQDVRAILGEKEQIIRKSGILEYTASVQDFGQVGGLGQLKRWLQQRNAAFSERARKFGLPPPRGVMLVGVPGCGKSLCAKAVAAEWRKPLLRFDLGRVFAPFVGEAEERMRRALEVAESVAPAILWIDEIEKGLGGIGGSGDSGVASRVFGNLLTWMEEKTKAVFVVMTANDTSRLPPELLRKGRLDEIFFIDLPTLIERADILAIHLNRRNRPVAEFDVRAVAEASEGFSGSELEQVVVDALFEAFSQPERRLTTSHLTQAVAAVVPLSRSRHLEIERMRRWAVDNCRMAAVPPEAQAPDETTGRRRRLMDL